MVIIDINNKRVHNEPSFDLDVVVVKGASPDLINNLTRITAAASNACKTTNSCGCVSKKVPLGGRVTVTKERTSKVLPQSIFSGTSVNFQDVYAKIGDILSTKSNAATVTNTFVNAVASRNVLQNKIAAALISNDKYVEALRQAAQASQAVNPAGYAVTTRNIKAAIALYALYSNDKGFSSTEASQKIASLVQVSTDTIARLGSELNVLRKKGFSAATRYFVSNQFGTLLIKTLNLTKFTELLVQVDELQDELDALGS